MKRKLPQWIKLKVPHGENYLKVKRAIKKYNLHTVCSSALCPNRGVCWTEGTCTFMLLGDVCSRSCKFCSVKQAKTVEQLKPPNENEIEGVIKAVGLLGLKHVVLTSVTRDDLPDGGARHLGKAVIGIKEKYPDVTIECLIPEIKTKFLPEIASSPVSVVAHNIEVTKNLTFLARDKNASYRGSLEILRETKRINSNIITKSSLMVGLGETEREVMEALNDLSRCGVDIVTIGQYLQPTKNHLKVVEFIHPEKFAYYEKIAHQIGFKAVVSKPLARSSFKAGEILRMLNSHQQQ